MGSGCVVVGHDFQPQPFAAGESVIAEKCTIALTTRHARGKTFNHRGFSLVIDRESHSHRVESTATQKFVATKCPTQRCGSRRSGPHYLLQGVAGHASVASPAFRLSRLRAEGVQSFSRSPA